MLNSKRKNAIVIVFLAIVFTTACQFGAGETQFPGEETDNSFFSARAENEEGAIIAWSGYSEGLNPGSEVEYSISITNETDQDWRGRFCLQLLDGDTHRVITTLEQREFNLQSGMGFSDGITVVFPEDLDIGAYGLSLAVRRPDAPMVDMVPIKIGETEERRRLTTQNDMDASLAACPPVAGESDLVDQAKADLAQRLGAKTDEIEVQTVESAQFPDASLGVPEPGKSYAQVVTPGYIIELVFQGETYRYHSEGQRVVAVPDESVELESNSIKITGVTASDLQIEIRGTSTLPDNTCLHTKLIADGKPVSWWPTDRCTSLKDGKWKLAVQLQADQEIQADIQYMVRVFQTSNPEDISSLAFDLSGPLAPNP